MTITLVAVAVLTESVAPLCWYWLDMRILLQHLVVRGGCNLRIQWIIIDKLDMPSLWGLLLWLHLRGRGN